MYLLQIWFNLADESQEEHIYDSYAMRKFMGMDFSEEGASDATTLLKFRHMLEESCLQKRYLKR
jgi:IS5 family transposase